MDLVTMDGELARLEAAVARAGRSLVQLEIHPTWAMLFEADVEGLTMRRRDEARLALADVFVTHAAVRAVIDAASAMRRSWTIATFNRLARLDALLHGTSVAVAEVEVPVAQRGLATDSRVAIRLTPDDALTKMAIAFDEVVSCVADVEIRWHAFPQRLADTRGRVGALTTVAMDGEVDAVVARLDELARQVLADPLAVELEAVNRLEAEVDAIGRAAARAVAARDGTDEVLVRLRTRIDDVRAAVDLCDGRYRHAVERLLAVPGPPTVDPSVLMECWESASAAARAGSWRAVADRSAELERSLNEAEERLAAAMQSYRELLDERDELRGRFVAYRAKAEALGVLDDSDVADALERARHELWTGGTDLRAAHRLLDGLQRAVSIADGAVGGHSR